MPTTDRLAFAIHSGQIVLPATGGIAVIRAQANTDYSWAPLPRFTCIQGFRPIYDQLQQQGLSVADHLPADTSAAIVHLTRSKIENLGNIAAAYQALPVGGPLVVDGAKTSGIESVLRHVKKRHAIDGVLSKSHGKLFWLTRHAGDALPFADWAADLMPQKNTAGFQTTAGEFSSAKIDPGSALLAEHLSGQLEGTGADLGAGWGWLSYQALIGNPGITQLDLYEAEHSAHVNAQSNVTDSRARHYWSDVTALSVTGRYDFILSNPPFHQSRKPEPELGAVFIHQAARMLKPRGQFLMVANRHLPYESPVDGNFKHWKYLAQTPQFKIFLAVNPLKGSTRR